MSEDQDTLNALMAEGLAKTVTQVGKTVNDLNALITQTSILAKHVKELYEMTVVLATDFMETKAKVEELVAKNGGPLGVHQGDNDAQS